MKQTAVQWIASNLGEYIVWEEKIIDLVEKALEMEKEQMMDAYHEDRPFLWGYETGEFFEQYYKETYETQND